VSLRKVQRAESANYLFLDLVIGPEARPGLMMIRVGKEWADAVVIGYPLNARRSGKGRTSRRALPPPTSLFPHARPLEQWRSRQ